MTRYCKAYKLEDLRKFPKWADTSKENEKEMTDEDIVYIQENLTVTKNCLDLDNEEDFIFTEVTPDWESYARGELKFEVPDWEAESAAVREALKKEAAEKEAAEKAEA